MDQRLARALGAHLTCYFDGSGVRRVRLDVATVGAPGLSYRVAHAWLVTDGVCRSVVRVLDGSTLAGTTVLLEERPGGGRPVVWIRPRTARAARRVDDHRLEDRILASDFSFDDLRFWTPLPIVHASSAEPSATSPTVRLRGSYLSRQDSRVDVDSTIGTDHGWRLRTDWRTGETHLRSYRADRFEEIQGITTPTRIEVEHPSKGYRSTMTLETLTTGPSLDRALFGVGFADAAACLDDPP